MPTEYFSAVIICSLVTFLEIIFRKANIPKRGIVNSAITKVIETVLNLLYPGI